jgi:phosphoserine phosphatase
MRAFAAEHDIDLSASYAYSDSLSDLPMLEAVGHPVVVNPDPALAEVAKREEWQVMRFERLGRRLAIGGAALLAAAVGWGGSRYAARRA